MEIFTGLTLAALPLIRNFYAASDGVRQRKPETWANASGQTRMPRALRKSEFLIGRSSLVMGNA
jgi:hypothetical protein